MAGQDVAAPEIKLKYKETVLGLLWVVLQPLLMMAIFTAVFSGVRGLPAEGGAPYPLFVLSGLVLWMVFSSGLQGAPNAVVANAHVLSKIYFPRLILPLSSLVVALFDPGMTLLFSAGLLLYYQHPLPSSRSVA